MIGVAARRQWRDERFRHLYLPTTRQRTQDVSVLFSDLAGFTSFSERATPAEVATVLSTYHRAAAQLIWRRFGGEIEKFMGDGMMATFNSRGDQPDHAVRAASAGLALQRELGQIADRHPGWPRPRIGVNTGEAVLREVGGHGHIAYTFIGDTINTGARLEDQAPIGGVLIGAETYRQLPTGRHDRRTHRNPRLRVRTGVQAATSSPRHFAPRSARSRSPPHEPFSPSKVIHFSTGATGPLFDRP
jgi:class 3 adenylate cyclase